MGAGKKSLKIFIYGVLSQVVTLVLGVVIPKLLIVNFGSEINGLISSIKQIFVYVALLEAGIGSASIQALYNPISKGDFNGCSEILAATNHYYKKTGTIYAVVVVILSLVYPYIIKSNVPNYVVFFIILLQGSSGVINFLFQGKYDLLLKVDGRSYVTTNTFTVVNIVTKIFQIGLILIGCNVLAVQFAYFITNLAQMLYITYYVKKHYKWLDLSVKPNYESIKQSKNVLVHNISGLIFNNTDMIILSFFCGLKVVSVYALYNLIISCIYNLVDTAGLSVEFALGQKYNSDKKEFNSLFNSYETYFYCLCFTLFTVTLIMLPSFIGIYSTGITDIKYVDKYLPLLFVTIKILTVMRKPCNQIINIAGHFKQTQMRSILESIINIVVSIVLVSTIGMYGVLIGTIVALLYRTNDIIVYTSKHLLKRSCWISYRRVLQNLITMIAIVVGVNKILPSMDNYLAWIGNAIWVTLLSLAVYLIVDSLFDKKSFIMVKNMITYYLQRILHKDHKANE